MVSFADWVAARMGTNYWVVAPRLTTKLRADGYRVAIPQSRFAGLRKEWELENGRV